MYVHIYLKLETQTNEALGTEWGGQKEHSHKEEWNRSGLFMCSKQDLKWPKGD